MPRHVTLAVLALALASCASGAGAQQAVDVEPVRYAELPVRWIPMAAEAWRIFHRRHGERANCFIATLSSEGGQGLTLAFAPHVTVTVEADPATGERVSYFRAADCGAPGEVFVFDERGVLIEHHVYGEY